MMKKVLGILVLILILAVICKPIYAAISLNTNAEAEATGTVANTESGEATDNTTNQQSYGNDVDNVPASTTTTSSGSSSIDTSAATVSSTLEADSDSSLGLSNVLSILLIAIGIVLILLGIAVIIRLNK